MTDSELIAHYGGPAKLARLLGFSEAGGVQRVQNWISRGIPSAVKVQFPNLLLNISAPSPELAEPQGEPAQAIDTHAHPAIHPEARQQVQGVAHA